MKSSVEHFSMFGSTNFKAMLQGTRNDFSKTKTSVFPHHSQQGSLRVHRVTESMFASPFPYVLFA